MQLNRGAFRVEYLDQHGYPQVSPPLGTYREALLLAHDLGVMGATGFTIFQDAPVVGHPCTSASKHPGAPRNIPLR